MKLGSVGLLVVAAAVKDTALWATASLARDQPGVWREDAKLVER